MSKEHRWEFENESSADFTSEERQLIRATIESPRMNERYTFFGKHFTRWRLMQATVLLFAIVVGYSFAVVTRNSDRIEDESKDRRVQVCDALNESFTGVIELVDALTTRPEGAPPPTPEQQERIDETRRLAREILVASERCSSVGD